VLANLFFLALLHLPSFSASYNYDVYHQSVQVIERHLAHKEFERAVSDYKVLFKSYDFIFLRDLKVASQVAAMTHHHELAKIWLQMAANQGWRKKHVKKHKALHPLLKSIKWPDRQNPSNESYTFIDSLFRLDQKMALRAFIRIREKSRQRFYETKFHSHSIMQVEALLEWLQSNDWPGEQITGNDYMISTIVSHHNSISPQISKTDTLFESLPLDEALHQGLISPFHYALMYEWRCAVICEYQESCYGYIGSIKDTEHLEKVNLNRAQIGLRSIELRNQLVDLQNETGIELYLPGHSWQNGKIEIKNP
jgi:hypothetical protein